MKSGSENNAATFSDSQLVAQFQQKRNIDTLGILYERYMHLVYGVCLKYLKEREWAKDGVTRIFEKLVVEIPNQTIENFKPWLYTITKNYCLMEIRSRKASLEREKKWTKENVEFVDYSFQLHPLDEETDAKLNRELKDCIEKLKNEQRQCIELFYFDEKCYQEIAENLNIQVKKVKSYIQNGKRNLKICLEKKHEIRQETK